LKRQRTRCPLVRVDENGSIHPQGWVPIETGTTPSHWRDSRYSSIHPQGWVPIETQLGVLDNLAGEL